MQKPAMRQPAHCNVRKVILGILMSFYFSSAERVWEDAPDQVELEDRAIGRLPSAQSQTDTAGKQLIPGSFASAADFWRRKKKETETMEDQDEANSTNDEVVANTEQKEKHIRTGQGMGMCPSLCVVCNNKRTVFMKRWTGTRRAFKNVFKLSSKRHKEYNITKLPSRCKVNLYVLPGINPHSEDKVTKIESSNHKALLSEEYPDVEVFEKDFRVLWDIQQAGPHPDTRPNMTSERLPTVLLDELNSNEFDFCGGQWGGVNTYNDSWKSPMISFLPSLHTALPMSSLCADFRDSVERTYFQKTMDAALTAAELSG